VTRRLAHVSDLHWGKGFLSGAADALFSHFKSEPPGVILVSGDLTQRAKAREFRPARRFFDDLNIPWLAVPGNHDVPLYPVHLRLLAPYLRYRKHFHPDLEPEFMDQEIAAFGLCSAHGLTATEGRLTRAQIAKLERRLLRSSPSQFTVLVLHHPLVHADPSDRDRTLWGAPLLIQLLARQKVDLIVSGHYHHRMMINLQDHYPAMPRPVWQIFSPTTLSVRGRKKDRHTQGFHAIEVADKEFSIATLCYESGKFMEKETRTFQRHF
jgi:3',5'-cyclic AMP phosphodiesterase CpdA